ncbi:dTMP kinase [Elusimicrobiota bacterium]
MLKGKFITFEGPEGCGKSTQTGLLVEYLKSKDLNVIHTREPGGVSIAEELREILLKPGNTIFPRAELMLYASGRAQHTQELIQPALEEGKFVVCERYTHASIAYQGYGRGLDIGLIRDLNKIATEGIAPDLTILIDIDVEEGLTRVRKSNRTFDRLESENIEFHRKVRQGYLKLAGEDPDMVIVDAKEDKEKIHKTIIETLVSRKII